VWEGQRIEFVSEATDNVCYDHKAKALTVISLKFVNRSIWFFSAEPWHNKMIRILNSFITPQQWIISQLSAFEKKRGSTHTPENMIETNPNLCQDIHVNEQHIKCQAYFFLLVVQPFIFFFWSCNLVKRQLKTKLRRCVCFCDILDVEYYSHISI